MSRPAKNRRKRPRKKRYPTIEIWKASCNTISNELLGFDAFNDGDDYDLDTVAPERFASGQTPQAFIEEMFEEDLARQEHDSQQQIESLEHADQE